MTDNQAQDRNDALIIQFKDKLNERKQTRYPTGTLIRFNRKDDKGVKRKYAALFAAKRWWTTSVVRGIALMSDDQFFDMLAGDNVTKVEVATSFERIK
ncbi:hypothetical protein SEA_ALOEVERA_16 [Microbacterium phage AloeVera]|uniref:Uncharacterized protein n=3 Tax=Akonivirus akoni TaxID=2845587 RepID=A0A6M3SZ17_9CAUD|nr:hypothetical protein HWC17_gp16 [Microbacterium phage Akoni]QCG78302.1 hypothetical protein SEA_AKONI_16 [Microbacterium phage Akoni]QJD51266.1 hypothetical protein SEA_TRUONG_16 [Microbacterium phage Truong]QJD51755.1 hypothetical protein SEA_ASHTON_16 [Microbacterium phage Ashton]